MKGKWVFIRDKENNDSGGSVLFIYLIVFGVVASFLYGLIAPDYEFYENEGDSFAESLCFDHWLFSSSVKGVLKINAKDNEYIGGYTSDVESEFTGRWERDKLLLDLDSLGNIWNNHEPLEVELIGDSIVRYRGRELKGGSTWFNFPWIY